jgi:uncharacterized delta-60 repeat protein
MRKVLLFLSILTSHFCFGQSAIFEHALGFGSSAQDGGSAICVDASGNIYITGRFSGTVDFDPGTGTQNLTSAGSLDAFVLKLNSAYELVWVRQVGGATGNDYGQSISVDASGNVYSTGIFSGTVDFDPLTGTQNRSGTIYTQKLNSLGEFVWVATASGVSSDARSVIDASGNVYVGGRFQGGPIDFDPGAGTVTRTSTGSFDAFALKLDTNGSLVWAKSVGGANTESGDAIAVDGSGNVYLTGQFQNTADFDPDAGTQALTDVGSSDAYLLKLNGADGSFSSVKQITGTTTERGSALSIDGAGNIFLGGVFGGTADFDPGTGTFNVTANGSNTIFIEKLTSALDFVWAKVMQGAGSHSVLSIAFDAAGGIYLTGDFTNSVDFNPDAGTGSMTTSGSNEMYIQKLNPNGSLVWVHKFGSTADDFGCSIFVDASNFIYHTGFFNGTTDFNPGTGTFNLTTAGVHDISFLKLSNSPVSLNITTQPQPMSVCSGDHDQMSIAASGTSNITYQWQKFNTSTSTFEDLTNNTDYSGVTTTDLEVQVSAATAGDYRVRLTGDFVSPINSNTVTVTEIALPPSPTTTSIVGEDCEPAQYTLTATSATPGEFRWYRALNANFPEATENVGSHTTPMINSSITYDVSFFDGACESPRVPATVTVNYTGPGSLDESTFVASPWDPLYGGALIDDFEVQSDGKVVVNSFEQGPTSYMLARLNADGSFDNTFNNWILNLFSGRIDQLELQGDKIIAGGRFDDINSDASEYIARFNADGTLDVTFNASDVGFDNYVTALEVLPDNKILAGGYFTTFDNLTARGLARLNVDGTLDGTFNSGLGPNLEINSIAVRPDGKILIGGPFTSYNGVPISKIALINADGTLDNSFSPPTIDAGVQKIVIQSDGKILIAGFFNTVGGLSRNYVARLNADGSHDLTFDPGTGAESWIYAMHQDSNGKILVGGWLQEFNDVPRNFIARLMPDGSLDELFDVGVGPYTLVTQIRSAGTDRLWVAGYIDSWNRNMFNGIGVIRNECVRTPEAINNSSCTGDITISACGGINGKYRWYTQASGGTEIPGETNSSLTITGLSSTTTYYVTLKDDVCESVRVPVVATITGATIPTVTNSSGCVGATQTVSASGGAAGQYRWYTLPSGGSPISGETNSSYVTPVLNSTTVYYVSIDNGTCEGARQAVTANIVGSPNPPSASNHARCGSGTVTLTASGGANGEYRWYTVASGGSAISGETNSTYTTPVLTTATTYYVALNNGTCESARVAMAITINPTPAPPEATNVSTCSGTSATISAIGGSNGNYRWYTAPTGGSAISGEVNSTFTTPVLTSTTTYYVAILVGGCESNRAPVQVTVNTCSSNAAPTIQTTSLTTQISGTVTLNLLALISDPTAISIHPPFKSLCSLKAVQMQVLTVRDF